MYICNQCGKEFAKNPDKCDNCNTIVSPQTFRKEHVFVPKEQSTNALKHVSHHMKMVNH